MCRPASDTVTTPAGRSGSGSPAFTTWEIVLPRTTTVPANAGPSAGWTVAPLRTYTPFGFSGMVIAATGAAGAAVAGGNAFSTSARWNATSPSMRVSSQRL